MSLEDDLIVTCILFVFSCRVKIFSCCIIKCNKLGKLVDKRPRDNINNFWEFNREIPEKEGRR